MRQAAYATIWLANVDGLPGDLVPVWAAALTPGEQQRYRAFVREQRQRQFVVGRMMLRRAVALAADIPLDAIQIEEQLGKAPVITLGVRARTPSFSISHSGPWVAVAVSMESAVGLDVEVPDPQRDIAALAAKAFGAVEASRLMALPELERAARFYEAWCRAEARFKLGQESATCYPVEHDQVAIALCAARALAEPPALRIVDSLPEFVTG
ncbi:4'-phosphopantetheinyl transferase family protein [Pseudoduganella sp. GCM10020061]|uniref:4'-phosphopantetheinyl transferase family protein n=1 Tax=Pseudoduganella sp. GCM10020061 TaxID=3317345 RepID=UPI00363C2F2C